MGTPSKSRRLGACGGDGAGVDDKANSVAVAEGEVKGSVCTVVDEFPRRTGSRRLGRRTTVGVEGEETRLWLVVFVLVWPSRALACWQACSNKVSVTQLRECRPKRYVFGRFEGEKMERVGEFPNYVRKAASDGIWTIHRHSGCNVGRLYALWTYLGAAGKDGQNGLGWQCVPVPRDAFSNGMCRQSTDVSFLVLAQDQAVIKACQSRARKFCAMIPASLSYSRPCPGPGAAFGRAHQSVYQLRPDQEAKAGHQGQSPARRRGSV